MEPEQWLPCAEPGWEYCAARKHGHPLRAVFISHDAEAVRVLAPDLVAASRSGAGGMLDGELLITDRRMMWGARLALLSVGPLVAAARSIYPAPRALAESAAELAPAAALAWERLAGRVTPPVWVPAARSRAGTVVPV